MTPEQQNLLLTVARILRAQTREDLFSNVNHESDLQALNNALQPFESIPGPYINEFRG